MNLPESNGMGSRGPRSGDTNPFHSTNGERNDSPAPATGNGHGKTESDPFKFRLYVAGNCANSIEAERNLRSFCRRHFPDRHEIEVVDVLREPERAANDKVLLTPLLLKLAPKPVQKIIGRLNMIETISKAVGFSMGHAARFRERYHAPKPPDHTADGFENGNST